MRTSVTIEELNAWSNTIQAITCTQIDTMEHLPEHRTPIARKPNTPRKGEMRDKTLDKHENSSAQDGAEKHHEVAAQMKALKSEHRKLRLHYVRKAKERLRKMEEAIKKEGAEDVEPTVPLDQVVTEVICDFEESNIEKIDQELQKHLDRIQVLCAKLRK